MNQLAVLPIKSALGIDESKKVKSESRLWTGMKGFFNKLPKDLSSSANKTPAMCGSQLLEAKVCDKVHFALKHQLDYMKYYNESDFDKILDSIAKKNAQATLTNSGCESNFAQLDLECKRGSGQTTLQTMTNRVMVKTNKHFNSEEWKMLAQS